MLYNLLQQQVQESIEWFNSIDNEFNYFRSLSSTLFMSEEYNGIGEVYKGGGRNSSGGTRKGEGSDGSGYKAQNGQGEGSVIADDTQKEIIKTVDKTNDFKDSKGEEYPYVEQDCACCCAPANLEAANEFYVLIKTNRKKI